METKYKPIPRFNDHGAGCKGHANWMLDCTFEEQEDRDSMVKALDSTIRSYEIDIKNEESDNLIKSLKGNFSK